MTLGLLFTLAAVILIAAALAWNFYPPVRNQLKGWTTVLEGVGGFTYWFMGQVTGGIQDAVAAGYIPSQIAGYVPYVVFIYIILKRFGTTTPVGQK